MGLVWDTPPWLARGLAAAPCMLTSEAAGCAAAVWSCCTEPCCGRFLGLYLRGEQSAAAGGRVSDTECMGSRAELMMNRSPNRALAACESKDRAHTEHSEQPHMTVVTYLER